MIDENTSCMEDKTLIENSKSSFVDHMENINSKQIDEILPLINEASFNLKHIIQPAVSDRKFLQLFLVDFDLEFIHK